MPQLQVSLRRRRPLPSPIRRLIPTVTAARKAVGRRKFLSHRPLTIISVPVVLQLSARSAATPSYQQVSDWQSTRLAMPPQLECPVPRCMSMICLSIPMQFPRMSGSQSVFQAVPLKSHWLVPSTTTISTVLPQLKSRTRPSSVKATSGLFPRAMN